MRILVVEDDDLLREFLLEILRAGGYEVLAASHGEEALQCLRAQAIDILVTDLVMPQCDGVALIAQTKRHHPQLRIIAMSGRSRNDLDVDSLQLVRALGADVTLQKPFTIEQMEAAIAQLTIRQ